MSVIAKMKQEKSIKVMTNDECNLLGAGIESEAGILFMVESDLIAEIIKKKGQ